jgi:molybdopterin-guanine dinucleotide biosynthesis protein A
MAQALDRGDLRAIAFHEAVRVQVVAEEELRQTLGDEPASLWFNVNTPDDLARANQKEDACESP